MMPFSLVSAGPVLLVLLGLAFGGGWRLAGDHYKASALEAAQRYAAQLAATDARVHAAEAAGADAVHATALDYQSQLRETRNAQARALAALHTGTAGLRLPGSCPSLGAPTSVPAVPAAGPGDPAAATFELPQPAAEFLESLASDADAVADQLRACQALVHDYIKLGDALCKTTR